jgi:general secretion pathway protein B
MSLILDALRKAERERELGQAPTIGSQLPHHRRPPRRRHGPWLAGGALVLAVVLAIGAWWSRALWRGEPPVLPSTAADGVAAGDASEDPGPAAAPTGMAVAPGVPAIDEASALDPVAQARELAARALAVAEAAKRDAELAAQAKSAPSETVPPASVAAPVAPEAAEIASSTPVATIEPDFGGGEPPASPEVAKPAMEPPPDESPSPPFPLVWELPLGTRQSLPRLAIAMHVYAEDPQRRFVILDDQRLVEGESASGGVTVREIRRDGVVLEAQGQRFLLPRGGL